ncbi:SRPBCC domain-containing protein [Glycomyces sp. NRRL B-16210]|uniref:SRPBCC domain-containing protein n=1 Tax=Glycomyces sp. NRRL B-16210 TaxID=1463821 RepID=UPI0004C17B13|nr:SRPBCC domain-containing protein [Glycomyces sp. NRRL B-16210]
MTAPQRPVHGTVTVSRTLKAPPERVWAAFADLDLRDRWFHIPGEDARHELDFRIGGGEIASGVFAPTGAPETVEWRSRFLELVEHRHLVFCYELRVDDVLRNLALVTVVLEPEGAGTRIDYTEQYVIAAFTGGPGPDGRTVDEKHVRGSLPFLLNRLEAALEDGREAPTRI